MVRKAAQTPVPGEDLDVIDEARSVFAGDIEAVDGVYTNPDGTPMGLYARLARIKGSLPVIDPEGFNDHFRYRFVKNTQVLGALRPRLARQQIMVIPETVEEREPITLKTAKGGDSHLTRLTVTWRVVDGVLGESFTGQSVGYGDDGGDKGANKAFTAAQKNFLIRLFEIGGEPDIEEDPETDRRARLRDTGTERVASVTVSGAPDVGEVGAGGKAAAVTEAQMTRIGQYARDLKLSAKALANIMARTLDVEVEVGDDKPWDDVRSGLEGISGRDAGRLIAKLDELFQATATPDGA